MKKSGIPRSEIFFTSKVPPRSMGYEETKASIESSFKQTGLDYIDLYVCFLLRPPCCYLQTPPMYTLPSLHRTAVTLIVLFPSHLETHLNRTKPTNPLLLSYLIHAPYGGRTARCGTWRALVEAQRSGKIRSIGVSNYGVHHLDELEAYIRELEAPENGGSGEKGSGGQISVGQWELHPWLQRKDIVEWCEKRGVVCEAYCPLVRGTKFEEEGLKKVAGKYGKTGAQVLIRWSLQKVRSFLFLFLCLQ